MTTLRTIKTIRPQLNDLFARSPALTRGMVFCSFCNEGAGQIHDKIYGTPGPSGTTWGQGQGGKNCCNSTRFTNDTRLNCTAGITVVAWFKLTGLVNSVYPVLVDKADYTSEGNNRGYALGIQAPNDPDSPKRLRWIIFNNNNFSDSYRLQGTVDLVAGEEAMAFGLYEPTTRFWQIGKNGVAESTGTGNAPTGLLASTNGLTVGGPATNGTLIYSLMIWNRALKITEISSLYKAPFQYSAVQPRLKRVKRASSSVLFSHPSMHDGYLDLVGGFTNA